MTDFPDWQAPQAHATSIAATGVPLLSKSTVVYSNTSLLVAGGAVFNSAVLPVNQIGWEVEVEAQVPVAATSPFLQMRLTWIDSASGGIVGEDTWIMPMSNVAPGWQVNARGYSKADQLQLHISNLDPSQTATLLVQMLANSRVYPATVVYNDPIQNANKNVPGWTLGPAQVLTEVLGAVSNTVIAASGSQTWLIPPGSGAPAVISVHTGANTLTNVRTNLYPLPQSVFGVDPPLIPGLPANADFSQQFIAPRAPMSFQISNLATTAITSSWSLVEQV